MPTRFSEKFLARLDRIDRRQLRSYFKELASENIFLLNVIAQLENAIVVLDKNACVRIINPQAEKLLGIIGKRITGKSINKCPLDPQVKKAVEDTIVQLKEYTHQEILVSYPAEQLLSVYIVQIEHEKDLLGWIVELQDITEIKKSSLQRIQTEKLKTLVTLAAGIAHELGNPLNSLGIHLQLLNREIKGLPKKNRGKLIKTLNIAQSEVKRLDQIISRFLLAARPLKPRFLISHIHDVIDETLALLGPEIRKHGIKIDKKYHTKIPKIYLDYIQLRQVFVNIIKNAIEAMPDGGMLKIITTLVENRIKIIFKDNGIGVPEDKLDKIFEPYYTTKVKGSGLGLMSVHRVIREHGGQIDIKSKIGKGTTVTILLPSEPIGPKLLPPGRKSR